MEMRKIRFSKVMTGDFARGISIPEKFTKDFIKQITKGFDLKVPSGETWHVGVDKHADELFLMSGWEDFVKAHELQENDLLIFTCNGNSSFDVLIFEESGCEKVYSLFGNRIGPNMCKCSNDMADQGQQVEHYSVSDSEDTTMPSQLIGSPDYASTSKKSSGKELRQQPKPLNSSNDHVKREPIGEEDGDDEYANSNYYYSRIANRLSDEEKEEIISLASIRSDNPAFVTVLQMSHVRRKNNFLIFPSRFVADHLDSRLHEITLRRPSGKDKWCVKYYCARDARGIRNYNFSKFVIENKLREGDICVFELMKDAKRVTMTVHVIRKFDDRFVLVG
ncbi:B3 domain-containing protein Os12g0592300-like [Phragmites australis]|uniref:B3 domain-containing protein Os12g0592300-like n=1 Tax=Phragmites australis TaxID=29695 RepID=UPI002D789D94|nr:B3 domain-containing protein Os12g0592300-like [Phragmites australis]